MLILLALFVNMILLVVWRSSKAEVCLAAPDLAKRDKTFMECYTYILLSLKNGDLYIGSTENVENRVNLHNKGKVKSTKANHPWKLLEDFKFRSRSEAFRYEKFLKTHQQKDLIRKKYNLK